MYEHRPASVPLHKWKLHSRCETFFISFTRKYAMAFWFHSVLCMNHLTAVAPLCPKLKRGQQAAGPFPIVPPSPDIISLTLCTLNTQNSKEILVCSSYKATVKYRSLSTIKKKKLHRQLFCLEICRGLSTQHSPQVPNKRSAHHLYLSFHVPLTGR